MVDEKEFEKIKAEHNKAALWIEFFSHKLDKMEKDIKELKKTAEETKEKEQVLGRSILNLMKQK